MPRNNKLDPNVSLVYSTDIGKITTQPVEQHAPKGDGIIRIHRETKGRKGKGVSVLKGFDMDEKSLKTLAQKIKKQCGCGGTVKDFAIEIQTDNRELIKTILEKMNYQVKLAGG